MKKIGNIILWVVFFPFMLTYWGWKTKKKIAMGIGIVLSLFYILISITNQNLSDNNAVVLEDKQEIIKENISENDSTPSQSNETRTETMSALNTETTSEPDTEDLVTNTDTTETTDENNSAAKSKDTSQTVATSTTNNCNAGLFEGYTLIEVDGGDLSGHRKPNVVVDIGFGDREYWAFTNEHGQLVKVIAEEIILQNEENEPVTSKGRYFHDEAKVPGVESKYLDEGHVIADSLGGVANAYNITPQNSTLNRHGDQAYMERVIRSAGGATNFVAIITYPNTTTQIPNRYKFTYTINGNVIVDEFDNINPDEANEDINKVNEEETTEEIKPLEGKVVEITKLDKVNEFIILKNISGEVIDMTNWKIVSVTGEQTFIFPSFTLSVGATVKIGDSAKNDVDFHWLTGRGVWNNSKSDPAELYNNAGDLIDFFDD